MTSPVSDVSVRLAWPDDAAAIGAVQVRTWAEQYADVLPPEALPGPADAAAAAETWRAALLSPGDARNRVLVALERATVVGYVVTVPSADPDSDPIADGEVQELAVHPDHRRRGHGSRLLQAAADTLAADRFTRALTWLLATDDRGRRFLTEAGWGPDGAHRELDLDGSGAVRVKQVRLHTALTAE